MDQVILVDDGVRAISVSQNVGRIEHRILVKPVTVVTKRQMVLLVEGMIHTPEDFVKILAVWPAECHLTRRGISQWHELQEIDDGGVAGSPSLRRCQYSSGSWISNVAETSPLVTSKEKRLVFSDWTAECTPELIALKLIASLILSGEIRIPASGVEHSIAQKFKRIAVEFIGAGLRHYVHYASGVLPKGRAVIAGLDAEFLERIRKREWLIDVGVFIHEIAAVELVTDLILARAVRRNGHASGKRLGITLVYSGSAGPHRSRNEQSELRRVTSIERKVQHTLLLDYLLKRRCRGIHLDFLAGNGNNFRGHAQLQTEIHRERLIRKQFNPAILRSAEAPCLDGQGIFRRLKGRNDVEPLGIRQGSAGESRALLGGDDFRGRDGGSGGVRNPADNASQTLSMRKQRSEQKSKKGNHSVLLHFCFPFRGQPGTTVSAEPGNARSPGASTTRLRLPHQELNKPQNSLERLHCLIIAIYRLNSSVEMDIRGAVSGCQPGNSKALV